MTLKKSICLIILLSYPVLMFAQNNLKERNLKTNEVKSMKSNNLPAFTFDRTINREEAALISEMNRIRNSGIPGSGEKLTELQKKIEKINNYSVTLSEHDNIQTPVIGENASANIDQRSLNEIYSGTYVKGIATQVEQNYSGAGTIWAAIGVGATDTGVAAEEDTLIVYRSLDNSGTSFSMFARIPIGSGNKFYPEDAIDMEIIELNFV